LRLINVETVDEICDRNVIHKVCNIKFNSSSDIISFWHIDFDLFHSARFIAGSPSEVRSPLVASELHTVTQDSIVSNIMPDASGPSQPKLESFIAAIVSKNDSDFVADLFNLSVCFTTTQNTSKLISNREIVSPFR